MPPPTRYPAPGRRAAARTVTPPAATAAVRRPSAPTAGDSRVSTTPAGTPRTRAAAPRRGGFPQAAPRGSGAAGEATARAGGAAVAASPPARRRRRPARLRPPTTRQHAVPEPLGLPGRGGAPTELRGSRSQPPVRRGPGAAAHAVSRPGWPPVPARDRQQGRDGEPGGAPAG